MSTITFQGKEKTITEVLAQGVVSSGSYFYIQCSETKEWCFAHKARMEGLLKRWGSYDKLYGNVISNAGKKIRKGIPTEPKQIVKKKAEPEPKAPKIEPPVKRVRMSSTSRDLSYDEWVVANIKYQTERRAREARQKAARMKRLEEMETK